MHDKRNAIKLSVFSYLLLTCAFVFAKNHENPLQTSRYILGLDVGTSFISNLGNTTLFPIGYSTFIYTPYQSTALLLNSKIGQNGVYGSC